jgi:predicted aconitase with swiveling domain
METVIQGRSIVGGGAEGIALVSDEPLSFWGGYDYRTGEITDRRHPLCGANANGAILVLPASRGSSTTTAVLLESVRAGTAPVALVTVGVDVFFALASIVAQEMYGRPIPIISVSAPELRLFRTGDRLKVKSTGQIRVQSG